MKIEFLSPNWNDMSQLCVRLAAVAGLAMTYSIAAAAGKSAEQEITGVVSGFVQPGEPGCTCGVVKDGGLAHAVAYGLSDLEHGKPLETGSVFNLASVSKQFTAFALLLLEQDGKLSLDDPLVKFMPELAASAQGVTLRQLVHHTGGLRDYIGLITLGGRSEADGSTIHESVQALARQTRPNAAPGVAYEYSNSGYMLLGVVIARVAGESLAEFSRKRIFGPLGMKNTSIVDRYPDGIAALARGYAPSGTGFVVNETGWEQVGDGQVHSDLHDLALWEGNFYSGQVGGRELIDRMHQAGLLNTGESTGYAAGLAINDADGVRWYSHGGSWVGYRSYLMRVPGERLSVIVLCNRSDAEPGALARAIASRFLTKPLAAEDEAADEEPKGPAQPAWQPRDLARYAGVFHSPEAMLNCRLYQAGGRLILEGCAAGASLSPGKAGAFVDEHESFSITFADAGADQDRFSYDTPGLRGLAFERVREPAVDAGTTTLIVNASIVDGTGSPARPGALRIGGDRIVEVGDLEPKQGEAIIDAGGMTLAPGFIDAHSHHDEGLFEMRDAAPIVSQGITTIVVGQDGSMTWPVRELFERMQSTPPAVNVATFVGHGSIRSAVMGKDFRRHATADELARMRGMVAEGMQAGGLGLATGLEYDPGIYASTEEVIDLAREARRFGGRYISHIRSEDRYFWEALDEIVRIGREADIPVQVTHMKLAMKDWWGQSARFLGILEKARSEGINVTGDIYPYEAWHSDLTVLFPKRDFTSRDSAQFALDHVSPPDGIILSRYSPEPALVGKSLAEVASQKGLDPAATLMDLIARSSFEGAEQSIIGQGMTPSDVAALIAWPHAGICSDGSLTSLHPRGRGAFTKVLRVYVREQKLLSLEEAIHKMTGLSAQHIGFTDRGVIRPGAHADLVLFDPATVADRSTWRDPLALSVGIERVWVNGVPVWAAGRATGAYPGAGLRRQ